MTNDLGLRPSMTKKPQSFVIHSRSEKSFVIRHHANR
jgi:hypothetical protein